MLQFSVCKEVENVTLYHTGAGDYKVNTGTVKEKHNSLAGNEI